MSPEQSVEQVIEETLKYKYTNEFLDNPYIYDYVKENITPQKYVACVATTFPRAIPLTRENAMTQFVMYRRDFYSELQELKSWAKEDVPNPKDYGKDTIEWYKRYKKKKTFLLTGGVGGIGCVAFYIGAVSPVVALGSIAIMGLSSLAFMQNARIWDFMFPKSEVENYLKDLGLYYYKARKYLNVIKEKKDNFRKDFIANYVTGLDAMIAWCVEDKNFRLREKLTKERYQVFEFEKHYDTMVKQIWKQKKKPVSQKTKYLADLICIEGMKQNAARDDSLLEYLNDVYIELLPEEDRKRMQNMKKTQKEENDSENEMNGYDGWLSSDDFKID